MTGCNVADLSIALNNANLTDVVEDNSLQISVSGIGSFNASLIPKEKLF